jgi:hypothetical protein
MNPFYNANEGRLRAGFRVPLFIILFVILMSLGVSIPLGGFQYLIAAGLLFGFFWMSFRFMDNRVSIREAGLSLNSLWWKEFGIGSLSAFAAMTLIFMTEWSMGDLEIAGFAWERISAQFWMIPVMAYLAQHLGVGFYEEFMARSYLINNIKEGFTLSKINPGQATVIGVVISSSIFGVMHMMNPGATVFAVLNIIGAGVMLAVPYVFTGRLALSVGIHFAWNFSQGGIYGFKVSGTEPLHPVVDIQQGGHFIWTGGSFGPEGGIIGLIGIMFVLTLVLFYIRKQEGKLSLSDWFTSTFEENQQSLTKVDELA